MTPEQISQLQELKKLLDAGILTQEEMLAEKAKILATQEKQPEEETRPAEEPLAESADEIEEVEIPLPTDASGRIIFEEPGAVQQPTSTPADNGNSEVGTKAILIMLAVLTAIILIVVLSTRTKNEPTHFSESEESVTDEAVVADAGDYYYNNEVASANEDEFAFDPWIGTMTLDGSVYRSCDSRCYLSFKKVSQGEYTGTIHVFLGYVWPEHEERFDPSRGYLEGTVRAKSDGNVLTVVMDRYTSRAYDPNSDDTNYFENGNITGQIFRITYNGGSYSAVTVGDMDGYMDDISVTK